MGLISEHVIEFDESWEKRKVKISNFSYVDAGNYAEIEVYIKDQKTFAFTLKEKQIQQLINILKIL